MRNITNLVAAAAASLALAGAASASNNLEPTKVPATSVKERIAAVRKAAAEERAAQVGAGNTTETLRPSIGAWVSWQNWTSVAIGWTSWQKWNSVG